MPRLSSRWLVLVPVLCGLATPAAAGDFDGGSVVALGFGDTASLSGSLAERFTPVRATGRMRLGGRIGRLGYELTGTFAAVDGEGLANAELMIATPTIAYHPLRSPWGSLALRVGLGYGSVSGERPGPPPPCDREPPCPGPTTETISHPLFALDTGATVEVHLGRRRGSRLVLFADVGVALMRVALDDGVVTGRGTFVTFGFGHGMAF